MFPRRQIVIPLVALAAFSASLLGSSAHPMRVQDPEKECDPGFQCYYVQRWWDETEPDGGDWNGWQDPNDPQHMRGCHDRTDPECIQCNWSTDFPAPPPPGHGTLPPLNCTCNGEPINHERCHAHFNDNARATDPKEGEADGYDDEKFECYDPCLPVTNPPSKCKPKEFPAAGTTPRRQCCVCVPPS